MSGCQDQQRYAMFLDRRGILGLAQKSEVKTNEPNVLSLTCEVTRTVCEYNVIGTQIYKRIKKTKITIQNKSYAFDKCLD